VMGERDARAERLEPIVMFRNAVNPLQIPLVACDEPCCARSGT
jgi:hypothetical protein